MLFVIVLFLIEYLVSLGLFSSIYLWVQVCVSFVLGLVPEIDKFPNAFHRVGVVETILVNLQSSSDDISTQSGG